MNIYKKAYLPLGFTANGLYAGIKKSGKLDLALFYSSVPAFVSGMFTTNKIQAAPVIFDKACLKKEKRFQAVIVNSGNANCFTGEKGYRDAALTSSLASSALGLKGNSVLVASTGIIGRKMDVGKIKKALPQLVAGLCRSGIDKAKKAILTTDIVPKEITAKFKVSGKEVTICAVAKGAGMIAPNMATMLCFIFTDALITKRALDQALFKAVWHSFNCITVDGCMSTNDSIMLMANCSAGNSLIDINKNFASFQEALSRVCLELAKLLVRDAEGASKFITITVHGAPSFLKARQAAFGIANSNLFKTAVYGENPNYGRIIAGVGSSGIDVDEKHIKIKVSSLKKRDVTVKVWLNKGKTSATVYTSDLTPEYIRINAEYN